MGLEDISIDFNENQRDEMPGKRRFSSSQDKEVKIMLLGAHMDFNNKVSKVILVFFPVIGKRLRTNRAWNIGTWEVVLKMLSTSSQSAILRRISLWSHCSVVFSSWCSHFFGIYPPFRLIPRPLATSSKSLTGQILFSTREFQEELRYSTAKLRDAISSRKINTRSLFI